jgi:sugar O-acyltransferase (sialic acid O-acetyltransferase NeuD family)
VVVASKRPIAVIGSSGHALSVLDTAVSAGFTPVAVIDSHCQNDSLAGLQCLANLSELDLESVYLCLGIGTNFLREKAFQELSSQFPGSRFPAIIHETAYVSPSAELADGVVVMAQVSIGPKTSVHMGALVNTGASLDHESRLGEFASLGPGARTAGNVDIGARTMVGMGASILQGLSIGADTVIGANSLVREDVDPLTVAYGVPSSTVRSRKRDDPYY